MKTSSVFHGAARIGALAVVAAISLIGCSGQSANQSSTTSAQPSLSAPLWAAPGANALPASTADALQQRLDEAVANHNFVGVSAAVVTPDGTWSGAAGADAAGTQVQPTSAMNIASITKTFIAAEVMLLSQRGTVDLDSALSTYVDLPFTDNGATVRQALGMRSGFPDIPRDADLAAAAQDVGRDWTTTEALGLIPTSADVTSPGGTPLYTNANYILLGMMIEKVTGTPLASALRADLLDPAGLERTWVQTAEAPTPPLTVAVDTTSKVVDPAGPYLPSRAEASLVAGSGSIAADAADVARWGYLLYGGHVIDSTLVTAMEADPQHEPSQDMDYALGTMVADDNGRLIVGHGGGSTQSPYTSVLLVWTDSATAVSVLVPQPAAGADDFARFELAFALQGVTG